MVDEVGTGDEALLAQDIDVLIDRAVVRFVESASNKLVGSGFLVAPDLVLTCRHVAASKAALEAWCGREHAGVRELLEDFPSLDLALVALDGVVGQLLAASGMWSNPRVLAGRAAVAPKTGIIGSAPFELRLNGTVSVQYLPDGTVLESAIDLAGTGVVPGASGSPLVDRDARAAVAVVVGGNLSPGVERVWAVPLEQAVLKWPALAAALARNDRATARYAMSMNARGAAVLFRVLSQQKQRSLLGEERFIPGLDVARGGLDGALSAFLASNEVVMAVVGASNVGKSWALAAFAFAAAPNEVRLMLEARALALPSPSLPSLVHQELAHALGARFMYPGTEALLAAPEKLGKVLRQTGVKATVVIDGLNEAADQVVLVAWLRQAIAWSEEYGIRLVLSCREESWPQLADALDIGADKFYRPLDGGPAPYPAQPWCFNLLDFSPDEASQAAGRYHVDAAGIGNHPLMYRLAQRLQGVDAQHVGRYRVLLRYVERQLTQVAQRFRLGPTQKHSLRKGLAAIADGLEPGGVGGVPLDAAIALVGGAAFFDALVTEGLLSASAQHARFRHDQLADVLRTVYPSMLDVFAASYAPYDTLPMSLAAIALLRYECEGPGQLFDDAVAALLRAFDGAASSPLKSAAVQVVRALPHARLAQIDAICRRLAESKGDYIVDVSACIADAPLGVELRVQLLLTRATHAGKRDGTGWPVRTKDWMEPGRRSDFVSAFGNNVLRDTPQPYLFQLLQQQREAVFPVLLAALEDGRRIGGEATVSSMCAGMLFVDAGQHLEDILPALLDDSASDAARTLGDAIIAGYPHASAEIILASLAKGNDRDPWLLALMQAQRCRPCRRTANAVRSAFARLRDEPARVGVVLHLAVQVRRLAPHENQAWHLLCDHWARFFASSGPIPDAKFALALEWIRARGVRFAAFVCAEHVGTPAQQVRLIDAIRAETDLGKDDARALGRLLERKLDQFSKEPDLQAPWRAYAAELVPIYAKIRSYLAVRAFSLHEGRGWASQLRGVIAANASDEEFTEFFAMSTLADTAQEIIRMVRLVRPYAPEVIDTFVWQNLSYLHTIRPVLDKATALVDYWRMVDVRSSCAGRILALIEGGESLDAVLKRDANE